jgi:hypothetical protein
VVCTKFARMKSVHSRTNEQTGCVNEGALTQRSFTQRCVNDLSHSRTLERPELIRAATGRRLSVSAEMHPLRGIGEVAD